MDTPVASLSKEEQERLLFHVQKALFLALEARHLLTASQTEQCIRRLQQSRNAGMTEDRGYDGRRGKP